MKKLMLEYQELADLVCLIRLFHIIKMNINNRLSGPNYKPYLTARLNYPLACASSPGPIDISHFNYHPYRKVMPIKKTVYQNPRSLFIHILPNLIVS